VIYIDPWLDAPTYPPELKEKEGDIPKDADLILVTHGHFDHASSAPDLLKASVKNDAKIACIFEIGQYYSKWKDVPDAKILFMNKGGTCKLDMCRITMVSADHSSSCGFVGRDQEQIFDGGAAAGWVVRFTVNNENYSIYHAGDTGIFGDMGLINELYKPTTVLLPIGGNFTMGPEEAAFAV
jgi:L-ascorbate metabolism protein UlaG (beta-lactamase superfamily)